MNTHFLNISQCRHHPRTHLKLHPINDNLCSQGQTGPWWCTCRSDSSLSEWAAPSSCTKPRGYMLPTWAAAPFLLPRAAAPLGWPRAGLPQLVCIRCPVEQGGLWLQCRAKVQYRGGQVERSSRNEICIHGYKKVSIYCIITGTLSRYGHSQCKVCNEFKHEYRVYYIILFLFIYVLMGLNNMSFFSIKRQSNFPLNSLQEKSHIWMLCVWIEMKIHSSDYISDNWGRG